MNQLRFLEILVKYIVYTEKIGIIKNSDNTNIKEYES